MAAALPAATAATADAGTLYVPPSGDLQAAINAAQPGDTILLEPGATYVGNFKLRMHGGTSYITIRSAAADSTLPAASARMSPAYAPFLPKIKSPNGMSALRTATGAAYWRLMFVELPANAKGYGDIITLGDGSAAQNTLEQVPHHLILDRVYIHGDALIGQKRGIGLNSGLTWILNSYISDIKGVGQDTQAIAGWNGPGPYTVENNYLEAAGEVFLLGGDDPKIAGLVPADVSVRRNTIARPLSWRNPILATPSSVRATVTSNGTLPAGTYAYRVIARRTLPDLTVARSLASADLTATVAANARIALTWTPVPDATEYLVYGRAPGAQTMYWRVTSPAFADDGTTAATAGTPPTTATVWQVKNLLELKNARRVQIDHNLLENNWAQAQAGIAVLFTPRNQYGSCTWCVVQDVTFEYNVVRSVAGAINIQGWDNEQPSQQTTNIRIRHNEISDLNKAWGGMAYFLQLLRQPKDVVVDHNTIISANGAGLVMVDSTPMTGFVFTNNVARHNTYGIIGSNRAPGLATISYFFPDGVVSRNVMAGGKASSYPVGNEFPTIAEFESHFVDYAGGDFALVANTSWSRSGTDGLDLGADISALRVPEVAADAPPPRVTTTLLPAAIEQEAYAASLQVTGGIAPFQWTVIAGAVPSGVTLDSLNGSLRGAAATPGDYSFIVQVADSAGALAAQALSLHVARRPAPVAITTDVVVGATATLPFMQAFDAIGGLGSYAWTAAGLPAGLSMSSNGVVSGTPQAQGTTTFTVTAVDVQDVSRYGSRTFTMIVAPKPNVAPTVSLTSSAAAGGVPVGSTLTLSANAADVDGTIARVDFYSGSTPIGSVVAAPFSISWLVASAGTPVFTAIAVDNDGAAVASNAVTVTTKSEIVIYASQASRRAGNYQLVPDTAAAQGSVMWNTNLNAAKVGTALTSPASYVEFTFFAEAGVPYHLWIRGRAEKNDYNNDSTHVQFDGVAAARIGSTASLNVVVEEGTNAGLAGYGWQDDAYGFGALANPIVFERTGAQTIRLQPREDGFMFDQIVLSPQRYLTTAPGAAKSDATIVAQ